MGFKVDSSFLRFLTMGALASQRVIGLMRAAGLQPIELERYSTSNKIWATKVKRLRLPDLLCVRTGLRVEVRAKSDLAIRMSDAPDNPARRWSSGLAPTDIIAFVHCDGQAASPVPAPNAELFWVADLLEVPEADTRLGPPKSAGEGSERDRTWASIVPSQPGQVLRIADGKIVAKLDSGRSQTYQLRGMRPYLPVGSRFRGATEFIAGKPRRKASFDEVAGKAWDPRSLLNGGALDHYVAAKALGVRGGDADAALLRDLWQTSSDPRVSLEAAGSLAKLGVSEGVAWLEEKIHNPREPHLRMEAIFILSELYGTAVQSAAEQVLLRTATSTALVGDESRQAAIWGLGRSGLRAFHALVPFLDADDENERIHAIVALGRELPDSVVTALVQMVADRQVSQQKRASALHVLSRLSDVASAARLLTDAVAHGPRGSRPYALAALGSLDPEKTCSVVREPSVLEELLPLHLLSSAMNWTRGEGALESLTFVEKQTVY